jgi:hypothetical protein
MHVYFEIDKKTLMSKQPFDFRGKNVDQKFKYLKCGDIISRTNIYELVIYLPLPIKVWRKRSKLYT